MDKEEKKILVIDDSATNITLLKGILEEEGFNVVTSNNPQKAMQVTQHQQPSLILLDLIMPHISGFRIIENLKNNSRTKNIPVIIISAHNNEDTVVKAIKLGAKDFLKKPIDIKELLSSVSNILFNQLRIR